MSVLEQVKSLLEDSADTLPTGQTLNNYQRAGREERKRISVINWRIATARKAAIQPDLV
jgi:hypothetical protein